MATTTESSLALYNHFEADRVRMRTEATALARQLSDGIHFRCPKSELEQLLNDARNYRRINRRYLKVFPSHSTTLRETQNYLATCDRILRQMKKERQEKET